MYRVGGSKESLLPYSLALIKVPAAHECLPLALTTACSLLPWKGLCLQ